MALGVVARLLRLYPRAFRDRFGADVLADLKADLRVLERGSLRRRLWGTTRVVIETAAGIPLEWLAARRRGGPMFRGMGMDLRVAVRRLRLQPALAVTVIGTLGLAIGASTAIFSVVDAVLLRPLPFPASEQLVKLDEEPRARDRSGVSIPAVEIWSREAPSLESVTFYEARGALVLVGDAPDRLIGATVSRNFMDVLGIRPTLGPGFTPGPLLGPPDEVVISHRLWQRLGADPEVVGRSLFVDPRPHTVVGVMPPAFDHPGDADFWTSPPQDMSKLSTARSLRFLSAVGRLRHGATLEELQRELVRLTSAYPAEDRVSGEITMMATGLQDSIVGPARPGIAVVAVSAVLLLVIACTNVAALLLARTTARHRDLAVQSALGASGGRLVRQDVLETLLLSLAAALVGVVAAWLCRDVIVALTLDEIPRIASTAVNGRALGFACAAALGACAISTVLPGRLASRVNAGEGILVSRGSTHTRRTLFALRGFVVLEVAITMMLAVGGLLLGRTLYSLGHVDRGFSGSDVVAMKLHLPLRPRLSTEAQRAFYDSVQARIAGLPGIESVAFSSRLPLSTALASTETHEVGNPGRQIRAIWHAAGPGYFQTIGTPFVDGTDFSPASSDASAVVNDVLARHLFGASSAVGREIVFQHWTGPVQARIVGVTRPIRYNGLASAAEPEIYVDYRVTPVPMFLFTRVSSDPEGMIPLLKGAILQADVTKRATVDQITTLRQEVARRLARPRFFLALVSTFGVVALVLAGAGLYGVLTFAVAQRKHELGVRLALGATPRQFLRDVVGRGAMLTSIGIVAGAMASLWTARLMQSLLFGISSSDPRTYAAAAGVVMVVALVACWLPARRAQKTDPLVVLRST